ncbi:hypothetical protein CPLU01_09483 [Colletotrichum plurivorum]|uniref:DUF6604 domain-containing protein n=1 Tax=Colletotrichum plurivorum TaxID=2175906 RepID=A0A8H6K949_9PEZI|nr:hypothetical protein CPLU01_09483 [Colletotrichum plurivorum]
MEANDVASKRTTSKSPTSKRSSSDSEQIEEIKGIIFSNRFASLRFADDAPSEPQEEEETESEASEPETEQKKKSGNNKKKGKGKKAKKTRKAQKTEVKTRAKADINPNEMSPKSYRLLEDDGDLMTNYTMAILTITAELSQMRHYLMNLWHEVAAEGAPMVVAGAVSHVATLDRDIELTEAKAAAKPLKDCPNCEVDVREKLLLYAYQDLVDFVTDFQKSRNGRPTKAMRARLGNWDPEFSLEDATKEERIKWRRVYTISYLCFSEPVDWSPEGPTGSERRLLGMTEFAAFVNSLVTQKSGVDFLRMILPHHVFQLQCIVDATTIAQFGWMLCPHGTHSFAAPCDSRTPLGEIHAFLFDHPAKTFAEDERTTKGADLEYQTAVENNIVWAADYLSARLGQPTAVVEDAPTPPSLFSHLGRNAVWKYSYFMCGVGLAEALQITYSTGMRLLDLLPEPTMVAHIELLLGCQGYFEDEEYAGLPSCHRIRALYQRALFGEGNEMPHWFEEALRSEPVDSAGPRQRSAIAAIRLSRTALKFDAKTGEHKLLPTPLLGHLFAAGWQDPRARTMQPMSYFETGLKQMVYSLSMLHSNRAPKGADEELTRDGFSKLETILEDLEAAKIDIWDDVHGVRSLSSTNFPYLIESLYTVMTEAENMLYDKGHKFVMDLYSRLKKSIIEKRFSLARLAMTNEDSEVTQAFTKAAKGQYVYWTDVKGQRVVSHEEQWSIAVYVLTWKRKEERQTLGSALQA